MDKGKLTIVFRTVGILMIMLGLVLATVGACQLPWITNHFHGAVNGFTTTSVVTFLLVAAPILAHVATRGEC